MKIAVIGSGIVGETLADGFLSEGHDVLRASRNPAKLEGWRSGAGPNARVGTFEEAAAFGECVVLAVLGAAAEAAVDRCGAERLAGKIVIDTTNPIDEAPPEDGVLRYFTEPNDSLMERLQARAPGARFVKAFSCVGNALMVRPDFGGEKPTMFICGDDPEAKVRVGALLDRFGWETADMGTAKAARAIEPLAMLWCIPGLRENRWTHAFRLLTK